MTSILCSLANKYGTDKGPKGHNYTPTYNEIFAPFRKRGGVSLLEIGVKNGASMRMWSEFFVSPAKIVGIDINDCCSALPGGFAVEIGDQSDYGFLDRVTKRHGVFDIIIDDGSHKSEDQKLSFFFLWDHLKPGGWYCIEDVHTSYMHRYGGGLNSPYTFIEYVKSMIDAMHLKLITEQPTMLRERQIKRMIIEEKLILVRKK